MSAPEICPVEVDDLTVRYSSLAKGGVAAVDGVSLKVRRGEVVALLGPNGAGKTTLLETLEGYRSPTSGKVRVLGHDPRTDRNQLSSKWGVMPQAGGIPMGLTVRQAVRLFSGLHGYEGDTEDLLQAAGLADKQSRRWRRLSGGEQQRLSLVLALCGGREILLLDEPTAAVDAAGRQQILKIVAERSQAGAGVLVTTHRFDDVEAIADRVIILNHGTMVANGSLAELTTGFDEVRFETSPELASDALGAALELEVHELGAGHYLVKAAPDSSLIADLTSWLSNNGYALHNLHAGQRRLEDIFLELTTDTDTEGTEQP